MCICSEGKEEIGKNLMNSRVKGWHELGGNEKVLRIMGRVCCDETSGKDSRKSLEEVFCCRCSHPSPDLLVIYTVKICYE